MIKKRKKTGQGRVHFLAVVSGFIFLSIIFVAIPFYLSREEGTAENGMGNKLTPGAVLNNKSEYDQEEIVIRGKVSQEAVVCDRRDCQPDDPCCGCPDERDLLISDAGRILTSKTKERLRLLDFKNQSLCRRIPSSCDYDCQDWVEKAIYDVKGTLFVGPPSVGWRLSLDHYFEVEEKTLVGREGLAEIVKNILSEFIGLFGDLRKQGQFVLQ